MRRPNTDFDHFSSKNSGQAMIEYLLMLVVAISLIAAMGSTFRKTLTHLWGFYIRQISAACPKCPANPSYKFK